LLSHSASVPAPVALCALVPSGDPSAALALARRHLASGVASFKLKVGPERMTSEQDATFTRLRAELGAGVQLRADANGSLSPDGLRPTLEKLAAHGVEFLEEPLAGADPTQLAASPCPLALDESLQRIEPAALERWLALPELRVVVLKPTALGGFAACIRLAEMARAHGRDVLVSHTLEGPIGWAACAHLALALGGARAAGLSPLAHQVTLLPRIERGRLMPSGEPGLGGAP
jgi:O-succinylbenzoate synthase